MFLKLTSQSFPIMTVNLSGDFSEKELRKFGEYLQNRDRETP